MIKLTSMCNLTTVAILLAASLPLGVCAAFAGGVSLPQGANRVSPVYTPVPIAIALPVPPESLGERGPLVVPMTGPWKFAITAGMTVNGVYHTTADLTNLVTSSSQQSWTPAVYAIDGDISTSWQAADSTMPQWLEVDLGSVRTVAGIDTTWGGYGAECRFKVEGSADNANWTMLADETADPGFKSGPIDLTPTAVRYVRVTIEGVTQSQRRLGGFARALPASIEELSIDVIGPDGKRAQWQPDPAPADDGFASPSFEASSWHTVTVPSNWEIAGYSRPTYNSVDDAAGMYRRWVNVPASFAGKRVYWRFDGVFDGADIFVNGKHAGYHESGYTAFDVDLTGLVVPGKPNLFAVRACKKTSSEDLDTGDYEAMGGIFRETFLYATPQTHVSDLTVRTDLDSRHVNATLTTDLDVSGQPGSNVRVSLTLYDQFGKPVNHARSVTIAHIGQDGTFTGLLTQRVDRPSLWSAEKPNLYYLIATLGNPDSPIEVVEQRFGFRQITISPQEVVLWNGVPIKCAGTCRHEIYPTLGAALNDFVWKRDIALMKAANINAIRTSHYNHASQFLDLCEESGFYIMDETPFCWAGQEVGDPRYLPAFLERAEETYARDKNRPEVLAWSCGNESGGGGNAVSVLNFMHAHDATRPAFISQQWPSQPGQSFLDDHYPKPSDFNNMLKNAAGKTPIVFTEQPHMFSATASLSYDYGMHEFWGSLLQKSWETVEKYPTILGSFIWEWQNQPIVTPWDDNAPNHLGKPTVWFENNKGVVDGYRNPKPEWWAVKMVYSPVQIPVRIVAPDSAGVVRIPVINRYSFTNLSELSCNWDAFSHGKAIKGRGMKVVCGPLSNDFIRIRVPAGTTDIRLTFWPAKMIDADWLGMSNWYPDFMHAELGGGPQQFSDVYSALLHVAGAPLPQPPAAAAGGDPLRVIQSDSGPITISNSRTSVAFDKQSGLITSWTLDGRTIISGGPALNLGQTHEVANQYGQNSNDFVGPNFGFSIVKPDVEVSPGADGHAAVTVTSEVAGDDGSALGNLVVAYDLSPDAQISVHWTLNWTSDDRRAWEAGLTLKAPAGLTKMSWFRDVPLADYPVGALGAPSGSCNSNDVRFSASKRDLHWLTLTSADGHGLALLTADDPLLARAKPSFGGITLFASRDEAADVELSTPWVAEHDITLTKAKPIAGSFVLRAL
jgi:beta-galactosidase